jgi:hypothetical protein
MAESFIGMEGFASKSYTTRPVGECDRAYAREGLDEPEPMRKTLRIIRTNRP